MKRTLVFAILTTCATGLLTAAVHVSELAAVRGTIGLGTWNTQSEYKDIEVTAGDTLLYRSNFTTEAKDWKPSGGDWKVVDGAYRQGGGGQNLRSVLNLPDLAEATDYTVRLKARKIAGNEGFMVLFHVTDNDLYWASIGGWNNTSHGISHVVGDKRTPVGGRVPGKIESGRWYDIRIELTGPRIKCFLDGVRIIDVND
jgi:hypothetical protein